MPVLVKDSDEEEDENVSDVKVNKNNEDLEVLDSINMVGETPEETEKGLVLIGLIIFPNRFYYQRPLTVEEEKACYPCNTNTVVANLVTWQLGN